jgi:hypothetical protein
MNNNTNKNKNAQSFGRRLVSILGEKHEQLREARFLVLFIVGLVTTAVLTITIFMYFKK